MLGPFLFNLYSASLLSFGKSCLLSTSLSIKLNDAPPPNYCNFNEKRFSCDAHNINFCRVLFYSLFFGNLLWLTTSFFAKFAGR